MAHKVVKAGEEVVVGEQIGHVGVITINQPRQLNVLTPQVISLLAKNMEIMENYDNAEAVIIKGIGRAFCAGGDLKSFYNSMKTRDYALAAVYTMYWLCYHIHTYKKTLVALVHGLCIGGGASLMVPMKFSIVTEKTVFYTPESSIGFHSDCGLSYMLSHLPGFWGEFLGLTGIQLNGKELVAFGLATHFVPFEKLIELEKPFKSLNTSDENVVKSTIELFSVKFQIDKESIINKQLTIDECFSKNSMEEIINSFEAEANKEGNDWIWPLLKSLKSSSPIGLKIILKSIREGRKQTLAECLKKEFRLTINLLRSTVSNDVYEGIKAVLFDKDSTPKWDPPSLDKVEDKKLDLVFQPFQEDFELQIPESDEFRWDGKYENTAYANLNWTASTNPKNSRISLL